MTFSASAARRALRRVLRRCMDQIHRILETVLGSPWESTFDEKAGFCGGPIFSDLLSIFFCRGRRKGFGSPGSSYNMQKQATEPVSSHPIP